MYVTAVQLKNGNTAIRLAEGHRIKGKVKTTVIKTLGQSDDAQEIARLRQQAQSLKLEIETRRKQELTPEMGFFNLFHTRGDCSINDGIQDIFGAVYKQLGFEHLISETKKDTSWNVLLKYCVFARLFEPSSKRKAVRLMLDHFQMKFSHHQILRMMDHVSRLEGKIKDRISKLMLKQSAVGDILLFDVTSLYFENTTESDLKAFGYSKDSKFKEVQLILALITDAQGLPVDYQIFPGNTAETKTFIPCLEALQKKHRLKTIRVTADKAMFSKQNLSYLEESSACAFEYIISCPLRKMPRALKEQILDPKNYTRLSEDQRLFKFPYEGKAVFVIHSKKKAAHDAQKRRKVLEMIRKAENATGAIQADKLVKNRGMSRYLETVKGSVRLKQSKVFEDSKWDGIMGLATNIKHLTAPEAAMSYKKLWKIEESFRINKHTLKMRPIYHYLSSRIRAHILICFLSYTILRYTELFLKSKHLSYGVGELLDILCQVERWVLEDEKTKRRYMVLKRLTQEASKIYRAFGIKREEKSYLLNP